MNQQQALFLLLLMGIVVDRRNRDLENDRVSRGMPMSDFPRGGSKRRKSRKGKGPKKKSKGKGDRAREFCYQLFPY